MNTEIEKALVKRLEDSQTFSPAYAVLMETYPYRPQSGETYLRTNFLPAETESMISETPKRYSGALRIQVVFPASKGGAHGKSVADAIIESQFPHGTVVVTESGLKVKVPREPWASPLLPDPSWPRIPITVPYSAVVG